MVNIAFSQVFRVAARDFLHEWRMSVCFVLALAAVLAPMLVLFGLKFGIVTSMANRLIEDPRNREIRPVGSGRFDTAWFESLRARDDVAFVVPRTRSLAATMEMRYDADGASRIITVEMIPSAAADPLLTEVAAAPGAIDEIVLSADAARKLGAGAGAQLDGSVARVSDGRRERSHLPLRVLAVAPPQAFPRDGAFVSVALLAAIEDYRDGRAVPALRWDGADPRREDRSFAGYRLFARSIYDVESLQAHLTDQGLEVRTRRADIAVVQSMDRNLAIVFWVIAVVAMLGFTFSLGASLWANVDRKRRELSILRLLGFHTGGIVWFPVLQAVFIATLGWSLACAVYLVVEQSLNRMFAESLKLGEVVCRLLPWHFVAAIGLTLLVALVAAALGGLRAAGIEPSEGLREV